MGQHVFLEVYARLAPRVELEQAQARLSVIAERVARDLPAKRAGWNAWVLRLELWIVRSNVRLALFVLLAAAGLVLLNACVQHRKPPTRPSHA